MTAGGRSAIQRRRGEAGDPWSQVVEVGSGVDPQPQPGQGHTAAPSHGQPWIPRSGWTAAPSWRRTRVSRAILLGILVVQALLSLRLRNTAFEDEALYLYVGHLQLDHFLYGTPGPPGFTAYLSGSPVLYPVLAAAVDSIFGLAGARALSLVFMLGATVLVYSLTRLLFNERAGLCAAAAFATTQSTLFLSNFATYDAAAVFLLALAAWIVVRTAPNSAILACLLAAPVAALAVVVKYAALLFLPTIVILAALAAFPRRRWKGMVLCGVLLPAFTVAVLAGALALAGGDQYLHALRVTTTARAVGDADPLELLLDCLGWGGGFLALALLGTVSYARRERMGEVPVLRLAANRGRLWRLALGVLLCGTALLAPAYQMHLHTGVSLHKHVGYGLLFAAPIAGVGMSRLVGAHFRYPQLAILIWVTLLTLGMTQSQTLYHAWADSTRMVAVLESQLKPRGRYLVEATSVPRYYLRASTTPDQWASTYAMTYTDRASRRLTGERAYQAAIGAAYFDVIVLDRTVTKDLDDKLVQQLRTNGSYRLLAKLPYRNSSGSGYYQIWVKR